MIIDQIKAEYPNPVALDDIKMLDSAEANAKYCVGGAFCQYYAKREILLMYSFPTIHVLGTGFCIVNPKLSTTIAEKYAKVLIRANDRKDFERAWKVLEEVLEYKDK